LVKDVHSQVLKILSEPQHHDGPDPSPDDDDEPGAAHDGEGAQEDADMDDTTTADTSQPSPGSSKPATGATQQPPPAPADTSSDDPVQTKVALVFSFFISQKICLPCASQQLALFQPPMQLSSSSSEESFVFDNRLAFTLVESLSEEEESTDVAMSNS
jgi:hypothetical protein